MSFLPSRRTESLLSASWASSAAESAEGSAALPSAWARRAWRMASRRSVRSSVAFLISLARTLAAALPVPGFHFRSGGGGGRLCSSLRLFAAERSPAEPSTAERSSASSRHCAYFET